MSARGPLTAGTAVSLAVVSAWSWTADLTEGPAAPLHLGRNLPSDYAQLAAAPTGNGRELFAVITVIYAPCLLVSALAPPAQRRCVMGRRSRASGKFIGSAVAAGVVMAAVTGHHGPAAPGGSTKATVTAYGSNEALANQMAASGYGWTAASGQQQCLDALWTRENAAWNPAQWNLAGSGAYGIPQALPASKMAAAGPDWQTNPATQIKWGLGYIGATYGTPCNAWGHETADGWY